MFFFKQKTAYDIRISGWSSDVCSSDLQLQPVEQFRRRWLFLEARNVAKLVEDVQRLCDQHLLDAGEVHVDDRLHRLPVGKLDVVEKAAPQKGVGQFLLVVRRSEEHTSELQSLMRISSAVFCLKNKKTNNQ